MTTLLLIVLLIISGLLLAQRRHHGFLLAQVKNRDIRECFEELDRFDKRFKEFDDYKKKVDALVLKNGFKL